jgi:hypothetical protein
LPTYFTSLPPQAENIPARARKKRRLEESLPTAKARTRSTRSGEAARKTASPDLSVGLPPSTADDDDDTNTDAESVTDAEPNNVATGSWTLDEDAKLTSAVAKTSKKRWGKEYKIDWVGIFSLVPGRTRGQCQNRWRHVLGPSIDRANGRKGYSWTAVEDSKLKDAVQTHGGKDWAAITALVAGRTKKQCHKRWHCAVNPSITLAAGRTGKWTAVEDSKLMDAVRTHGDKDWGAIAALVPRRTRQQCCCRWHHFMNPRIAQTGGSKGKWTEDEDIKLKDAIQTHGGKNWGAVTALVPGRTKRQCSNRWHTALDPGIALTGGSKGKWTSVEDIKLKDAVRTHGGKNWGLIAALVPGRTRSQCNDRWKKYLDPSIDRVSGRKGKWTEDEDSKLKDAVLTHGDKDWKGVAALVPGRTKIQCWDRWKKCKVPNGSTVRGT